jgi:hypothetical protein
MVTPEPDENGSAAPIEAAGWPTSLPSRLGSADVTWIETTTRNLRAVDHQYGGGTCYEALMTLLSGSRRMLGAEATDAVTDRLHVALADLHNLAGWTAFDTNRLDSARTHLDRALTLARTGGDDDLVANISYRRGRIHLHHGAPDKALTDFELGQHAAQAAGSPLAAALLHANQAWASAKLGRAEDTHTHLAHSMTDLARSDPATAPTWAAFFDTTEISAISGVIHTELAHTVDPAHTRHAIPALTTATDRYRPGMTRSRSLALIALATSHLLQHDLDHAATVGAEAVRLATTVRSTRVQDRLLPLKHLADRHPDNTHARELSEQIHTFTTMQPGCHWATHRPAQQPCTPACATPCTTVWRPPPAPDPTH